VYRTKGLKTSEIKKGENGYWSGVLSGKELCKKHRIKALKLLLLLLLALR